MNTFTLSPYFGDHAVLQRGEAIRLRGGGTPGDAVFAKLTGATPSPEAASHSPAAGSDGCADAASGCPAAGFCGCADAVFGSQSAGSDGCADAASGCPTTAPDRCAFAHPEPGPKSPGIVAEATCLIGGDGVWQMELPPLPAGGPYTLVCVCGSDDSRRTSADPPGACLAGKSQPLGHTIDDGGVRLTRTDIYIGDVWLLGGQSNMQLPMERVKYRYPEEYRNGASGLIRQFCVPYGWDFHAPRKELSGGEWIVAAPHDTPQFSAVGFFFARAYLERTGVPVGLILTAVGGTPIESWVSKEALEKLENGAALRAYDGRTLADALSDAALCRDDEYVRRIQEADLARDAHWHAALNDADPGLKRSVGTGAPDAADLGFREGWASPDFTEDASWKPISLCAPWEGAADLEPPGAIWFRRWVDIPPGMAGRPLRLELGTIIDADQTFVNGEKVGETTYRYPPRMYVLPGLSAGKHLIAVRVEAIRGRGGFTPGKAWRLILDGQMPEPSAGMDFAEDAYAAPAACTNSAVTGNDTTGKGDTRKEAKGNGVAGNGATRDGDTGNGAADGVIDISAGWHYRRGATCAPLPPPTFFERKPYGMYQGMVAPLHGFPIAGILWYQGEMNADEASSYPALFAAYCAEGRERWGNPDLPVIYVQLPDYRLEDAANWPGFRAMQARLSNLHFATGRVVSNLDMEEDVTVDANQAAADLSAVGADTSVAKPDRVCLVKPIPHTAMVAAFESGEANDLHPTCKKPIGELLAQAAATLRGNR